MDASLPSSELGWVSGEAGLWPRVVGGGDVNLCPWPESLGVGACQETVSGEVGCGGGVEPAPAVPVLFPPLPLSSLS